MSKLLKSKKSILITGLIIIILVFTGNHLYNQFISSDQVLQRGIKARQVRLEETKEDLMSTDQITVVLVGTAGPMAPDKAQQCTAVFVNGQFLLFDAGDYAAKRMEQFELPVEELDAIFLTHYHNDHIADVGEVMQRSYILGRENDLVVYGPTGAEDLVTGFNLIYAFDSDHRTEHHGEEIMPLEYQFATASEFDANLDEVILYREDGVVVTAFKNSHPPIEPSFGYVVEYSGKKVVISGDTLVTDELAEFSKVADVLVMDIMNYELVTLMEETFFDIGNDELGQIMYDIKEYHPDVHDVAKMAEEQNVKRLALTHYAPSLPNKPMMNRFYIDPIKAVYNGELIAESDGAIIVVPID
jgi:ribonuclease Z